MNGDQRVPRLLAVLLVERLGRLLRLIEPAVELERSARVEQLEQHHADRDHRDDDDHGEEQPQAAAEGGLEQGHDRRAAPSGNLSGRL